LWSVLIWSSRLASATAYHRVDQGQNLPSVRGLIEEVIRTQTKAKGPIFGVGMIREHHFLRRRGSASILQYAQHIECVAKVETDVDQNQVGLEGGNLADRPLRRCAVTDQVRTGRSNSRG